MTEVGGDRGGGWCSGLMMMIKYAKYQEWEKLVPPIREIEK